MGFLYEPPKMHTSTMPSLLFVDDDVSLSTCPPSSPKRCDRGQPFCITSMLQSDLRPPHASSGGNSMRCREHPLSFCTEELGSESTSGVGHPFSAPLSFSNANIFYDDHIASMPAEAAPSIWWTSMPQPHAARTLEEVVPSPITRKPLQSCSSDGHTLCQDAPKCRRLSRGGNAQTFPPPLSSLLCERPLMRSFKSNGRFVLKRIDNVSRSLFRSTRKDGRLRLDLLSSCYDTGLHEQCPPLFPASARDSRNHYPPYISRMPSVKLNCSATLVSHKPTLNYDTLPTQALTLLLRSRSPGATSFAKEPKPALSESAHIAKCVANAKKGRVAPRVVALLNLLPAGLGVIILEFGQSKCGSFVTLHGVYILKGLDGVLLSRDPFFTNLCGVGAKVPQGKLLPI